MDLETTAYHEAGHAVAHHVLGFDIRVVTIVPSKGCAGIVSGKLGVKPRILEYGNPSRATVAKWHAKVVTFLAGAEAQRRFKPHSIRRYMASSDHRAVVGILFRLHPEQEELNAVIKYLEIRTRNLVGNPIRRGQIEDLASAIIAKRTLTGQEVRQVLVESYKRQCEQGQAAHAGGPEN